jgi:hypothetical protein
VAPSSPPPRPRRKLSRPENFLDLLGGGICRWLLFLLLLLLFLSGVGEKCSQLENLLGGSD